MADSTENSINTGKTDVRSYEEWISQTNERFTDCDPSKMSADELETLRDKVNEVVRQFVKGVKSCDELPQEWHDNVDYAGHLTNLARMRRKKEAEALKKVSGDGSNPNDDVSVSLESVAG